MKPLVLTMQAFGPFAGTQVIDFQQLDGQGFFLIHGPVGAGKTSVLDALCFALFGDSSGGEREPRQLRSHHADRATLTTVTFEFALGARRLRVHRVPDQQRPARRGDGETRQAPQAELCELVGGEARPLAAGWGPVTAHVTALLGFESRHFRQIVVLPQGRFSEFLKSGSNEREKILQVLFGTELYKRIEEALKRAADEVAQQAREVGTRQRALLDQAEVADEAALAQRRTAQASEALRLAAVEQAAHAAAIAAGTVLAQARQAAALFQERDAAEAALAALQAEQAGRAQQRHALQRARLALALAPLDEALQEAATALAAARATRAAREAQWQQACAQAAQAAAARDALQARAPELESLALRLAELQALATRVQALDASRAAHAQALARQAQADARSQLAQAALHEAQQALDHIRAELDGLRPRAARLAAAQATLEQLTARAAQQAQCERLGRELAALTATLAGAEQAAQAARTRLELAGAQRQEVFQHWLAGQSARIAHSLRDGEPCPVCGGREHPQPAQASEGAASDAALEQAERRREAAAQAARAAEAALADARAAHAGVAGQHGALRAALGEATPLDAPLREARTAREQAEAATHRVAALEAALPAATAGLEAAQAAARDAQQQALQAHGDLQRAIGQWQEREQAVPAALASGDALNAELARVGQQRDQLRQALAAAQQAASDATEMVAGLAAQLGADTSHETRQQHVWQARDAAFRAQLAAAGFADAASWRAALRSEDALQQAEAALAAFEQALAVAAERNARALQATSGLPRPDVAAAAAAHQQAQADLLAAGKAVAQAQAALATSEAFLASLGRLAQDYARLEGRHAILRAVADVANGHNPQRISFQRYVLATLLDEVLAASTLRLRTMSRGRFEMRRRLDAVDARSAGGLDLEVFDHYTGTTRAVQTLSGGESFLASLALALGLSDVVQSHAGGVRLDAIFIDEGFGALDPDALDLAMRALQDLQRTGRLVGVISHVAELKEWIPARLELQASPRGSQAAFVV